MRRAATVMVAVALVVAGSIGVALGKATAPEVDPAAATFGATYSSPPVTTPCAGEDSATLQTQTSKLSGTVTEGSSGGDFKLGGPIAVRMTNTSDTVSGLGWTSAQFTLRPNTTKKDRVLGSLLGVSQTTGASAVIRGLAFGDYEVFHPKAGAHGRWVPTGDELVANVEFSQDTTGISGQLGGTDGGTDDLAAKLAPFVCG